jgi:hypothetical protein
MFKHNFKLILFLVIIQLMHGCFYKNNALIVSFKNSNSTTTLSDVNVSNVSIVNNQVVISGTNLSSIINVKIQNQQFSIESKNNNQIIANAINNVNFAVNQAIDLVIGSAEASATFPITFSLNDHSVDLIKLTTIGATSGNVILVTITLSQQQGHLILFHTLLVIGSFLMDTLGRKYQWRKLR